MSTPNTSPAHQALSNRLKAQFQQPDSDDEDTNASQDWFVNDVRETPTVIKDNNPSPREPQQEPAQSKAAAGSPTQKRSSFSESEESDQVLLKTKTGFLHLRPIEPSILILELCKSDQSMQKMYGTKYFKVYLPQIVDSQTDFCLYCRKRLGKNKIRFSLSETNISKWNNPSYVGKLAIYKTANGYKYKIVCPKRKQRVVFTIEQDNRKYELKVHFNAHNPFVSLFQRLKPPSEEVATKFINPVADVRDASNNTTLLQIDKEGDATYGKHVISYMRPFSMLTSACIAVAMESHVFGG
ncbi:hypothetical protein AeMF1_012459 [Aphanomyces euteiches]|nr:hypothetical protein AeMF1_012459 [Aphanomyces euteiches]